jgi:hypothetical protein
VEAAGLEEEADDEEVEEDADGEPLSSPPPLSITKAKISATTTAPAPTYNGACDVLAAGRTYWPGANGTPVLRLAPHLVQNVRPAARVAPQLGQKLPCDASGGAGVDATGAATAWDAPQCWQNAPPPASLPQ